MDRTDYEFLRVNANVDYTAYKFADLLRNCMRCVASGDPNSAQTYHAADNFVTVLKLINLSEGMPAYELIQKRLAIW